MASECVILPARRTPLRSRGKGRRGRPASSWLFRHRHRRHRSSLSSSSFFVSSLPFSSTLPVAAAAVYDPHPRFSLGRRSQHRLTDPGMGDQVPPSLLGSIVGQPQMFYTEPFTLTPACARPHSGKARGAWSQKGPSFLPSFLL